MVYIYDYGCSLFRFAGEDKFWHSFNYETHITSSNVYQLVSALRAFIVRPKGPISLWHVRLANIMALCIFAPRYPNLIVCMRASVFSCTWHCLSRTSVPSRTIWILPNCAVAYTQTCVVYIDNNCNFTRCKYGSRVRFDNCLVISNVQSRTKSELAATS